MLCKLNKSNLEGLFFEGFLGLRFGGLIFFWGGEGEGEGGGGDLSSLFGLRI